MFLDFFLKLKDSKIPVSINEFLTFLQALEFNFAQFDVNKFYYLARASLVKDEKLIDKVKAKEKKDLYINKKKDFKEKKPSKIKLKVQTPISDKPEITQKKQKVIETEKSFTYNNKKTTKVVHMCKSTKECDINVISKIVSDRGKEKSFPKINF